MENFYIGQDVVAICNHPQGHFKEGDIFTIKGLKQGCCNMAPLLIDVGAFNNVGISYCTDCNKTEKTNIIWYCSSSFKPLDSLVNIDELTEVLNEPIFGAMIKKGN